MTTKFIRFTQRAREGVRERFNSVMGLLSDLDGLRQSFERQAKNKACGVDGVKKEDYGVGLEQRIAELSERIADWGIGPSQRVGSTFRKEMGGADRWGYRALRTGWCRID